MSYTLYHLIGNSSWNNTNPVFYRDKFLITKLTLLNKSCNKQYLWMLTMNCSTSLSMPTLGRSGIMWATTLKPASFERWKDSHTARTVCPLKATNVWKFRNTQLNYTAWGKKKKEIYSTQKLRPAAFKICLLPYLHLSLQSVLLTCWCRGPHLHTHSGLLSPAGCSRSPACRWGVASGSSRVGSQWWFPHIWCYCAQSTCRRKVSQLSVYVAVMLLLLLKFLEKKSCFDTKGSFFWCFLIGLFSLTMLECSICWDHLATSIYLLWVCTAHYPDS